MVLTRKLEERLQQNFHDEEGIIEAAMALEFHEFLERLCPGAAEE
jgi:hypothetical protein